MNVQQWGTPAPPNRSTSQKTESTWREGLGAVLAIFLGLAVLFSVFVILFFVYRDSALYEEITDYLDKTASVSKINYQPHLGYFEIRKDEVSQLGDQRNYKSLLYFFLFADAATLFFVTTCILLFYTSDVRGGKLHIIFWLFLIVGGLYSFGESSAFTFFLMPYSAQLPNSTESLLDRAIPYNPGGLLQMEHRLGCTFNQNLYNTFQRKNNPRNTCDPLVLESFISLGMMISFIVLRLVPIVLFIVLMIVRPVGEPLGNLIVRFRPKEQHRAKYIKKANAKKSGPFGFERTPQKSTTFDANEKRTPPVISSPIDHTLSYNNAAYFAVSGANLHGGSSRSSEIDAADLFHRNNGSIHTQNSLVSEV
ncbi:Protein R03H10.2 [Aphelenchoides fujianensis]|nr:Protein R03H10.2 [Aphelenchoides fujianensis]